MVLSGRKLSLNGKSDYERDLLRKLADLPLDMVVPVYDRGSGRQVDCLSTVFVDGDRIYGSSLDAGEERSYGVGDVLVLI